jgi:hypothetical protein
MSLYLNRYASLEQTAVGPFTLINPETKTQIAALGINSNGGLITADMVGFTYPKHNIINNPAWGNAFRPTLPLQYSEPTQRKTTFETQEIQLPSYIFGKPQYPSETYHQPSHMTDDHTVENQPSPVTHRKYTTERLPSPVTHRKYTTERLPSETYHRPELITHREHSVMNIEKTPSEAKTERFSIDSFDTNDTIDSIDSISSIDSLSSLSSLNSSDTKLSCYYSKKFNLCKGCLQCKNSITGASICIIQKDDYGNDCLTLFEVQGRKKTLGVIGDIIDWSKYSSIQQYIKKELRYITGIIEHREFTTEFNIKQGENHIHKIYILRVKSPIKNGIKIPLRVNVGAPKLISSSLVEDEMGRIYNVTQLTKAILNTMAQKY